MPVARPDERSYIHMKNLPWQACRKDIKEFFDGLSVKQDGISLRLSEAFVAFEDPLDVVIALSRKERMLLGNDVQLSGVHKKELPKEFMRIVRRKLDFRERDGICRLSKTDIPSLKRRKIRPTPVARGQKRSAESCLAFCPEESELPAPDYEMDPMKRLTDAKPCKRRCMLNKKKLHPTSVSGEMDLKKLKIFHPAKCYEIKKMKLSVGDWQDEMRV